MFEVAVENSILRNIQRVSFYYTIGSIFILTYTLIDINPFLISFALFIGSIILGITLKEINCIRRNDYNGNYVVPEWLKNEVDIDIRITGQFFLTTFMGYDFYNQEIVIPENTLKRYYNNKVTDERMLTALVHEEGHHKNQVKYYIFRKAIFVVFLLSISLITLSGAILMIQLLSGAVVALGYMLLFQAWIYSNERSADLHVLKRGYASELVSVYEPIDKGNRNHAILDIYPNRNVRKKWISDEILS